MVYRDESYWREGLEGSNKDLRLMVKRTFITNSLGEDALPKWASWVKVVVDGTRTLTSSERPSC